ncbi:hypothetical protein ACSBL2_24430 [Pedobacter sp. AW31-3R]|uniref:hypothetical protein n=1 Tax=Pedobacter sp. AW31-3R TaxID=3445781 RepID=UPI003FA15EAC
MNYKYILSMIATCALLILNSCKKDEETLTPSGITDGYVLPQGNNDFDNTIVDYYKKYNTYLLYKFDRKDIYWTPIGYTIPTLSNGYWSPGHEVLMAEEAYIPAQLALLKTSLFDLYSEKFLKKFLPSKILLCSKIDSIAMGFNENFQYVKIQRNVGAYTYYNSICVNYGNVNVTTMTAADRTAFTKKVNTMLVESIMLRSLTTPTNDFNNSADYATSMTTYAQSYGRGIIAGYSGVTSLTDWGLYIKAMVTLSETQLNKDVEMPESWIYPAPAPVGILNPKIDVNGQIQKRYTIVRNYFISEYGIDLQTIGNAANPSN